MYVQQRNIYVMKCAYPKKNYMDIKSWCVYVCNVSFTKYRYISYTCHLYFKCYISDSYIYTYIYVYCIYTQK